MSPLRRLFASALLLAASGCATGDDPAFLEARLLGPPLARQVVVPGLTPPPQLWGAQYELEIQETKCVDVTLTFVQVQVFEEGFQLFFGAEPDSYDPARLAELGLSRLAACEALVLRGFVGSIGAPQPRGPVRVLLRVIGTDARGHGVGLDVALPSPLQVGALPPSS
jgi:hypothetical protein